MDPVTALVVAGGVATASQLLAAGVPRRALDQARTATTLVRPRRGLYALAATRPDVLAALAAGGWLACISALAVHGIDTAPDARPHYGAHRHAGRVRRGDAIVHWDAGERPPGGVAPLADALAHAIRCQPEDWAIAALDSVLRTRADGPAILAGLRDGLSGHRRELVDFADRRAGSCIESLVRRRLARLGILPDLQARLGDDVFVDMLLPGRLVIELDGRRFHTGARPFERDRRRDAWLHANGYRVLRFSYAQVVYDWPSVERTILAVRRDLAHR